MRSAMPAGRDKRTAIASTLRPRTIVAALVFGFLACAPSARAFPPAPYYTVFGDVRDEFGNLISAGGGSVIFSVNTREIARYPVTGVTGADYNYQIRMRMDMSRLGTSSYSSLAVNTGATYTLAVDIGGVTYLPLEMTTPPSVGNAADRRRINLTLGQDSDRDGLPDAWEQMQLYMAGLDLANLGSIAPGGDLDGDGLSNFQEYIAGTYASDPTETFYLKIKSASATAAVVEFFTITGKTYAMEQSSDLKTWSPVTFSVGATTASSAHVATGVGPVEAQVTKTEADAKVFYRLKVR